MNYQHHLANNQPIDLPVGKVVCIGRNYAEHARELNNPIPSQPLLFIKPNTAICDLRQPLRLTAAEPVHFETELAVLIGKPLTRASVDQVDEAIVGIGLGLDLTLRQLQNELKAQGHPWERAKAFDNSCPLSPFVPYREIEDISDCRLQLSVDGSLRQNDSSANMLMPVRQLLAHCSEHFTLLPGDVVLTGTPAGVGVLEKGMQLRLQLEQQLVIETEVV